MSKAEDTLNKAYGSIPKEITTPFDVFDWLPTRSIKYGLLRFWRYFSR